MKQGSSNKTKTTKKIVPTKGVGRTRSGTVVKRNSAQRKKVDDIQYVLPLGNAWVVKNSKAATFTTITVSKKRAISIARALAQTDHTLLIVYYKNGAIQIKESYVT